MFFDTAVRYQVNLQDSATYGMEMIIQLHNYVMFLNVFIISVVIWFFFEIIAVTGFIQWFFFRVRFRTTSKLRLSQLIFLQINKAMLHMSTLEVIWTLLPVLALISIALPSLSMLYYFSLSFSPAVVINVIGHQWFWSYEYQSVVSPFESKDGTFEVRGVKRDGSIFKNTFDMIIRNAYKSEFVKLRDVGIIRLWMTEPFSYVYGDLYKIVWRNIPSIIWNVKLGANLYFSGFSDAGVKETVLTYTLSKRTERYAFDSIMVQVEDLNYGSFRLLEVDKPLYLPVDTPIRVIVSSDDVLHSWAVPSLGVKIDCVPGRLNVVEFRIARTGVFYGQCSEICGTQHGFMPICIVSIPRKLFNFI